MFLPWYKRGVGCPEGSDLINYGGKIHKDALSCTHLNHGNQHDKVIKVRQNKTQTMTIIIYHYAKVRVDLCRDTPQHVFISLVYWTTSHLVGLQQRYPGKESSAREERDLEAQQSCICGDGKGSPPWDIRDAPIHWGANYCLSCLCSPCILVKPPDFLRGSRDPHPVPMQRRGTCSIHKFWGASTLLVYGGLGNIWGGKRQGKWGIDDRRGVMPDCIIDERTPIFLFYKEIPRAIRPT